MEKWQKKCWRSNLKCAAIDCSAQALKLVLEQSTTLKHSSSAQSRHSSAPSHFECPSRTFWALEHW